MVVASAGTARSAQAPRGQMVVIFALTLVVVMVAMAMAIDLSALRSEVENAQRVANAAALAGVIFMPSYQDEAAFRAREEARKNGFSDGEKGVSVTPAPVSGYPDRLQVTISENVSLFFGRALGFGQRRVSVSAMAEYFQPLQTGAPDNVLGYAPFPTKLFSPAAPEGFYLENKGPYTYKESGDAYTPVFESFNSFRFTPSGADISNPTNPCGGVTGTCTDPGGTTTTPNGDHFSTGSVFQGYNYIVDDPLTNTLVIKLFDPYDEVDFNNAAAAYDGATGTLAPSDSNRATTPVTDSTQVGPASIATNCILGQKNTTTCNSKLIDQLSAGSNPFGNHYTTLGFTLYGRGLSAVDANLPVITSTANCATDNCVLASPFLAGQDPTTHACAATPNTANCTSPYAFRFLNYAIVHGPGIFRLNVQSMQNPPPDFGAYGTRGNAFGIAVCSAAGEVLGGNSDPFDNTHAGWNANSCADPNMPVNGGQCANPANPPTGALCLHVYGLGKMAIHNFLSAGKSVIPLGSVPAQYAGKTLLVRLYDVGNVGDPITGTNSLEVLTPAGTETINSGTITGGGYASTLPYSFGASPQDGSSAQQGYLDDKGTTTSATADQALQVWSNSPPAGINKNLYKGTWLNITVPLVFTNTNGYTGMTTNVGSYWKMLYNIGGAADEATTWSIDIAGSPVHLVYP